MPRISRYGNFLGTCEIVTEWLSVPGPDSEEDEEAQEVLIRWQGMVCRLAVLVYPKRVLGNIFNYILPIIGIRYRQEGDMGAVVSWCGVVFKHINDTGEEQTYLLHAHPSLTSWPEPESVPVVSGAIGQWESLPFSTLARNTNSPINHAILHAPGQILLLDPEEAGRYRGLTVRWDLNGETVWWPAEVEGYVPLPQRRLGEFHQGLPERMFLLRYEPREAYSGEAYLVFFDWGRMLVIHPFTKTNNVENLPLLYEDYVCEFRIPSNSQTNTESDLESDFRDVFGS